MRENFETVLRFTLREEGGDVFTDNANDYPTRWGITLPTLMQARGKACTADDVSKLTREEAKAVYRALYWDKLGCDALSAGVDLMAFECAVNPGPGFTATALQGIAGVRQDGLVGPATLAAVANADPLQIMLHLASQRVRYWLSRNNVVEEMNEKGWVQRGTRAVVLGMLMRQPGGIDTRVAKSMLLEA